MMRRAFCIAMLITISLPWQARASNSSPASYSRASFFTFMDSWKKDSNRNQKKLRETAFGIAVNQVIGPRIALDLFGTATSVNYSDPVGGDISFSSLNDVRIQGTYYLRNRLAAVSISTNVPTGKVELSSDEYFVAREVSDNSRRFAVRRFGQGFDVGLDAFLFPKYRSADFAIGVGYLRRGGYNILASDTMKYRYGRELRGEVSTNVSSRPFKFHGRLILKMYGDDKYGSTAVYRAGNTIIFDGQVSYSRRLRGRLGFVIVRRSRAKISENGGNELSEESLKSGRDELSVFITGSLPASRRIRVIGRGVYKNISSNDFDPSSPRFRPEANYIGLSGGLSNQFSRTLLASLMATYYTGSVDSTDDLTGIGIAAVLTIVY